MKVKRGEMSQRTITSFFAPKPVNGCATNEKKSIEETGESETTNSINGSSESSSPLKDGSLRVRRRNRIESDSEESGGEEKCSPKKEKELKSPEIKRRKTAPAPFLGGKSLKPEIKAVLEKHLRNSDSLNESSMDEESDSITDTKVPDKPNMSTSEDSNKINLESQKETESKVLKTVKQEQEPAKDKTDMENMQMKVKEEKLESQDSTQVSENKEKAKEETEPETKSVQSKPIHSFFTSPSVKKEMAKKVKSSEKVSSPKVKKETAKKVRSSEKESSPKVKKETAEKVKSSEKESLPKVKKETAEKGKSPEKESSPKVKKETAEKVKSSEKESSPKVKKETAEKGKSPEKESSPKVKKETAEKVKSSEKESSPKVKKEAAEKGKSSEKESSPKVKKEMAEKVNSSENESSPKIKKEVEKKAKTPEKESKNQVNPSTRTIGDLSKDASKESGVDYNPSKAKYHPIEDACWKRSEKVPYLALARTLEAIENVSARLKMIEILSNYFRSVIVLSPDDLLPSIYLCLNKLAPAYEGIELGIAETSLMKAIAQSTGRTVAQIKSDAAATGDLGIIAEKSRSNQRMMFQPAKLTVRSVFSKLKEIAQMSGQAAMSKKVDKIQAMFVACRYSEARYIIRSLGGKLRIGLAEQSVLQALALACATTPPGQSYPPEIINAAKDMPPEKFKARLDEEALILKTTYCECPNYNKIVPILLEKGMKALPEHCHITPGIPLKPMLAQPTKGVNEVLQRFENLKFTCEWKYDGERAQIHLSENGDTSVYSRNQENNTTKYPDIIARLPKALGPNVTSCILDCEAVAWDKEKKQILPFQILSTRKRKDANEADIKVQVCLFMFDLLYLNGCSLVKKPLAERRRLLKENFLEVEEECSFAKSLDTTTMEEVQEFLEESVKGNCEGLMVKTLEEDATYEIAKRSRNWLKLKKDYLEGVGDTLDVVVIGGYLGRGKRVGTYGGFLVACYDKENEEYQSLCKLGTGFSDEDLQKHTEFLKQHVIEQPRNYYRYDSSHEPDEWFEPVQVWEIKCADLSLSPAHYAAIGIADPVKGVSLRFPRFIRIRDDKSVEDATTATQIAEMYRSQEQIKNQQGGSKMTEDDFY